MADYSIAFFNRDFTRRSAPGGLVYKIGTIRWTEPGGPDEARVKCSGSEANLWELLNTLRCPVELIIRGNARWWGYVSTVSVTTRNGFRLTASLDSMSNKIKVTYSEVVAGDESAGEQTETAWYENTDSTDVYGDKEKILSLGEGTSYQAIDHAGRALLEMAWPLPERDFGNVSGQKQTPTGELTLTGWYETLDWMHYDQDMGKESYEDIQSVEQNFGDDAATTKVAQSYKLLATRGWKAEKLMVRVRKVETPTDDLVISLANGTTGAIIGSVTIDVDDVPDHMDWVTATLATEIAMVPNTYYSIVVSRSGAIDATNYYQVDVNEALGYTRGVFRIWNGSAWVARGTDADMPFQVLGLEWTTTQIENLVTDCGQFLTDTIIDDDSNILSSPYRDGMQTGLECMEELLDSGVHPGLRLCASVTKNRELRLWASSDDWNEDYTIDGTGQVRDQFGAKLEREVPPVGMWMRLVDVIPMSANTAIIANPSRVYVTAATYDCEKGSTRWEFLGMKLR